MGRVWAGKSCRVLMMKGYSLWGWCIGRLIVLGKMLRAQWVNLRAYGGNRLWQLPGEV